MFLVFEIIRLFRSDSRMKASHNIALWMIISPLVTIKLV